MLTSAGGGIRVADPAHEFTLGSTLSGTGNFWKSGQGTLVLGASQSTSGTTQVQEGTLRLGATPGSGISVAGDALISAGAKLTGHGQVNGNLTNHGVVSPGSQDGEIGTLTVLGDYTQSPTGTFLVDVHGSPTGNDLLVVGGAATLSGTLQVQADSNVDWYRSITVLEASGDISGTYSTIASNFGNLSGAVTTSSNTVQLGLYRNDVVVSGLGGQSQNERSTAGGIDQLPKDGEIYRNVMLAGSSAVNDSLNALSGEIHANAASAFLMSERISREVISDQLREHLRLADRMPEMYEPPSGGADSKTPTLELVSQELGSRSPCLWLHGVGDELSLNADGNAAASDQNLTGVFTGANLMLGGGWVGGVALGHAVASMDSAQRASTADAEHFTIGLTAGTSWHPGHGLLRLVSGVKRTNSSIDTKRRVMVGNLNETLTASYEAVATQCFAELAYQMDVTATAILEPYVGLGWTSVDGSPYQEYGGASALRGSGISGQQMDSRFGLRYQQYVEWFTLPGWIHGEMGWSHLFGDDGGTSSNAFFTGSAFSVAGTPTGMDALHLELGLGVDLTDSLSLGTSYLGGFSESHQENAGRITLDWNF